MTAARRWTAMSAIWMFHYLWSGKVTRLSINHNCRRERRAEVDLNRCPSVYQPNITVLGQTGPQSHSDLIHFVVVVNGSFQWLLIVQLYRLLPPATKEQYGWGHACNRVESQRLQIWTDINQLTAICMMAFFNLLSRTRLPRPTVGLFIWPNVSSLLASRVARYDW